MYFLSIESSTNNFALAVSKDDKVLRYRRFPKTQVLEDAIIRHVDSLLRLAGLQLEAMDAFVISVGPGSFTSLRVGLSTVKAFAMALKRPVVGIGSLDVIAHGADYAKADQVCVVTDARRKKVYSALYQVGPTGLVRQGPYHLSELAPVLDRVKGRTVFVGDALDLYGDDIKAAYRQCANDCQAVFADAKYWLPDARSLARLGWQRLMNNDVDDALKLLPIYLYPSDCQVVR